MSDYTKPLPHPNEVSQPFWDAAKRHKLQIQRCNACGTRIFYPREACAECLSADLIWIPVSGKGTLYSYTIAQAPTHPAFADDVPYVIAIVELEEGPRITTNLVGCQPDQVTIGMPVVASFEDVTPEMTLVKFRPGQ
jgi:uncharacterized OB-fold protein